MLSDSSDESSEESDSDNRHGYRSVDVLACNFEDTSSNESLDDTEAGSEDLGDDSDDIVEESEEKQTLNELKPEPRLIPIC